MDKIRCPHCGAAYNETYDECPFCSEEEESTPSRHTKKKTAKKRPASRKGAAGGFRFNLKMGPDILTPVLGVLLVLMVLFLGYLLFGGSSSSSSSEQDEPEDSQVTQESETPDTSESIMPEVEVDPAPATSVALNRDDFTLSSGESWALEASGGSGVYTWSIEDSLVATVQSGGVVTAVGGGNTIVTVTDGYTTAECIVRVKGAAATGTSTSSTATSSTGSATLSHSDVTISMAESFTLSVSAGTASFTVNDATIASVSESGLVTGLSSGTATITASVGEQTLTCLVRVR